MFYFLPFHLCLQAPVFDCKELCALYVLLCLKNGKTFVFIFRKNVEDFTGPRERSDLGFITFDITADIL